MAYKYDRERPADENIAEALFAIANELRRLGLGETADYTGGAIELLSQKVGAAAQQVAEAVESLQQQ